MAAELGLLSLTQLQKLAHQQKIEDLEAGAGAGRSTNSNNINNNYWMWNPKQQVSQDEEEDESWEVKAFEQDTGNNITWPPRSYTCTFCRREFRSAQALGGHMNVHRRDRARLHHQTVPTPAATAVSSPSSSATTNTTLLIPAQEFGGGLCVLYSLPNPKGVTGVNSCMDSPSTTTLLSISPFESNNLIPPFPPPPPPTTTTTYPNYPVTPQSINSSSNCHESSNTEPSASNISNDNGEFKMEDSTNEELDLELRLGRR